MESAPLAEHIEHTQETPLGTWSEARQSFSDRSRALLPVLTVALAIVVAALLIAGNDEETELASDGPEEVDPPHDRAPEEPAGNVAPEPSQPAPEPSAVPAEPKPDASTSATPESSAPAPERSSPPAPPRPHVVRPRPKPPPLYGRE
jgi:outer membrane biosynthesis protein TonB